MDFWTDARASVASKIMPKDADDNPRVGVTARGALGTVADILGVVSVVITAVAVLVGGSAAQGIMALTLCALALTFLGVSFNLQRRFARESRRAQAGPLLVRCHDRLRDAAMALQRSDKGGFGAEFQAAAKALAEALTLATKFPCRVAVQDLYSVDAATQIEDLRVKTICRSEHAEHGSRESELPEYALVGENTDYLRILRQGARVFFSNDLGRVKHYKNSHFDVSAKPSEYPYRSTIVWPIVGPHLDSAVSSHQVIGFLCVDSATPRTFARHIDVPTGRAIASAMYSSLSLFRDLRETEVATTPVPGAPG